MIYKQINNIKILLRKTKLWNDKLIRNPKKGVFFNFASNLRLNYLPQIFECSKFCGTKGTKRSQKEPKGVKRNQKESKGTRSNQKEPKETKRNQNKSKGEK